MKPSRSDIPEVDEVVHNIDSEHLPGAIALYEAHLTKAVINGDCSRMIASSSVLISLMRRQINLVRDQSTLLSKQITFSKFS